MKMRGEREDDGKQDEEEAKRRQKTTTFPLDHPAHSLLLLPNLPCQSLRGKVGLRK